MKALPYLVAAGLACLNGYPASAQTVITPLSRPDSASVTVPDLAFTPSKADIGNFDDYFYFHKAGVSYERAFDDLDQCRQYGLAARIGLGMPPFIPLGGELIVDPQIGKGHYPGLLEAYLIQGAMDDYMRRTVRVCMAYKGYDRYGTSKVIWTAIDAGSDAERLARQAMIASSAQVPGEAIGP